MKLNQNGWGLSELLLFMAIMVILLLISAYYVLQLYDALDQNNTSLKTKSYEDIEMEIEDQARKYVDAYYDEIGTGTITITMDNLLEKGFIVKQDITPAKTNTACNGYVLVKKDHNDVLHFDGYLDCDGYESIGYQKWRVGN